MKVRISSQHLADAVAHTARALGARPTVPVMAGILLTAGPAGLELAAFDYEVCATDRIPAEVADAGTVLVPGRLLGDITARLPKGADVDLSADRSRLAIVCRSARFSLPLLPVEEYPGMPAMPPAVATITADAWAEAAAQVVLAAASDQTLPAFTGVELALDGDQATLIATDRYRIAWRRLTVNPTSTAATPEPAPAAKRKGTKAATPTCPKLLIPAKTLGDIAKAFASDRPLTLHSDSQGLVGWSTTGGKTFSTRLLDKELPDIVSTIPEEDFTVTVAAAEMAAAVQRVALVADRNTPIRLTVLDGELLIEAGSGDDAHGADTVPATVTGETSTDRYTVAFNPGFLTDGLKACGSSEVTIHLNTDPYKPCRLTASTGSGAEEAYRYVLMPVRIIT